MKRCLKVVFVYPDGHIEDIQEVFNNVDDAKAYGDRMVGMVYQTEEFHGGFGFRKRKPYYMIVEIKEKERVMVFDSRNQRKKK